MSRFAQTWLVARFTALDYRRHPAAWLTTLLTGVAFALMAIGAATVTQRVQDRAEAISFAVAVEGDTEGATRFLAGIDDPRLVLRPSSDAATEVTESRASAGVVLPDHLDERIEAGRPTELRIFFRSGNDNSQTALNTVALRIQGVEEQALTALVASAGTPVDGRVGIEEHEVRRDERVNRRQLSRTLAGFACLLCLGVVSSVASRSGRGAERRHTEPMLLLPLDRHAITAGIALGVFPMVSVQVLAAVGIVIAATAVPLVDLGLSLGTVTSMLVTALPAAALLGLLATATGALAGVIGTGTDDAVSLGDFFAIPFVAVGVWLFLQPDLASTSAAMLAPIVGPALALRDGVAGRLEIGFAVGATLSTLGWAAVLLAVAGRRIGAEGRVRRATR